MNNTSSDTSSFVFSIDARGFRHVILHLGGNFRRIYTTIALAKLLPSAYIIVSSEYDPEKIVREFEAAGIKRDRYMLNYEAWDTVTNILSTMDEVLQRGTLELHVVTDEFHMRRSMWITKIAYFGLGVTLHQFSHLGDYPGVKESIRRVLIDIGRTLIWKIFNVVWYSPSIKKRRMPEIERLKQIAATL